MAKVIMIGAGHNGLVTACYLAKAGHEVEMFESRDVVGGCAATDETTFPGFKISSASYVNSLFLPQIVEELELEKYGYEVLLRNPSSFTPLPNGEYLFLGSDRDANIKEIGKFSKKDAKLYPRYEDTLEEIASLANSMLTMVPPNLSHRVETSDIVKGLGLLWRFLKLGPHASLWLLRLLYCDARVFLGSWFVSEALKATLLTDAAIGAMEFSGYVLLHHVMGEAGGARGVWGYQRGGMGGISNALAAAAWDLGVKIHTGRHVREISINLSERAVGIVLGDGTMVPSDIVVSNADPKNTFTRLLSQHYTSRELERFVEKIESLDFRSPVMKVNVTLSGLPDFYCKPGTKLGPQHMGTIHLAPYVDYIVKAQDEGSRGIPSTSPVLEITIPSSIDDTLAPSGKHVMNIFVQYTPYHLKNGSWDDIKEEYFQTNIMGVLSRYISNIHEIVQGVQILSPLDLERQFSITEGNIFHGAMGLGQLFSFRPVRGYADYRTPIKNLYLCGAGTHPGGGVMGACGFNAAREIISDLDNKR